MLSPAALAALLCSACLGFGTREQQCSAQAGSFSEYCLLLPHQDSLKQTAHSHCSTAELFAAETSLAPGTGLPQGYLTSSASPHLSRRCRGCTGQHLHTRRDTPTGVQQSTYSWHSHITASMQSARPALGPQQAAHLEGEAHPGTGPTLPANSVADSHGQLAARKAKSSMQSGAIPVQSQRFSTILAKPPISSWTGWEQHQGVMKAEGFLPWKCWGTWPAAGQQSTSCFTAAVLSCSHFNLGRPKEPSNTCDISVILKLIPLQD